MMKCCDVSTTCNGGSKSCPNGWRSPDSKVPSSWVALDARPDLKFDRAPISEPSRYYHGRRSIVTRSGLLLSQERRHLWHELVHADRGDTLGHNSESLERKVERIAVRMAIPTVSLQWAAYQTDTMYDLADLLKLPEEWVRFRWLTAPEWEKAMIRRQDPVYGSGGADL